MPFIHLFFIDIKNRVGGTISITTIFIMYLEYKIGCEKIDITDVVIIVNPKINNDNPNARP